jgi:RNA polymerase sigma-70 factor (ECF subfamily)
VRSREEAEDIVQEAFVKIYLHAASFKRQENATFKSWGYRILLNTAYSHYRKLQRKDVPLEEFFDAMLYEAAQIEYRSSLATLDKREEVKKVLAVLPTELADLMKMHYFDGYSYKEIAELTGLGVSALKMRLYRARKLFKDNFVVHVNNTL